MKCLNLGCGKQYSSQIEWTNVDFISTEIGVLSWNLKNGIPFPDNTFDLVYHSHLLEHFTKEDGEKFIEDCLRILKPGGIIRIVVPDLERIAKNYLTFIEKGINNPNDEMIELNYDWTMLEMYDQTVRNVKGGNMAKYLFQDTIKNEDFVFERLGEEARGLRGKYFSDLKNCSSNNSINKSSGNLGHLLSIVKRKLRNRLLKKLKIDEAAITIGKFRLEGEIHQWMYDRYSLFNLLKEKGFVNIVVKDAFTSFSNNWASYNLDAVGSIVRKPDSLFMEAVK